MGAQNDKKGIYRLHIHAAVVRIVKNNLACGQRDAFSAFAQKTCFKTR